MGRWYFRPLHLNKTLKTRKSLSASLNKNYLDPQSSYPAHIQLLTFSVIRWLNLSHSLLIPGFRLVSKDDYANKIYFYFQVLIQHFLFLNHSYMIFVCSNWALSVYTMSNSWLALNNYTLIMWVFTLHSY